MKIRKVIAAVSVSIAAVLALVACGAETSAPSNTAKLGASSATNDFVTDDVAAMPSVEGSGADTKLTFPRSSAPEGLKVLVVEEGSGEIVGEQDFVVAHYVGQVWGNETAFDSSFSREAPTGFSLQSVIQGWTQGLAGLPAGSKVILSIPSDLGYGPQGGNSSAGIGADDTIAFYVEIVKAYAMDKAGDPEAKEVTSLDALPISYSAEIGAPIDLLEVRDDAQEPMSVAVTIIAEGQGQKLAEGDTAVLQYAAITADGSSSMSTYAQGGPMTQTVSGDTLGKLAGIPVGSRILLEQPSAISGTAAYYVMDIVDVIAAQ